MGRRRAAALAASALLLIAAAAYAAAGDLDASFSGDGRLTVELGTANSREINAVAIQPDGKIVLAGQVTKSTSDAAVWRLQPDAPAAQPYDTAFGGDGLVTIDSGGSEQAQAVAIQPDGKIVVGGSTSVGKDAAIYRLTPQGDLDTTFNLDGAYGPPSATDDIGRALAVQLDGKLLLAGYGGGNGFVYRILPNAPDPLPLDTGFGTDGRATLDSGSIESVEALGLQPGNKIVAAGWTNTNFDGAVYRLTQGGALDPTFNVDGAYGPPSAAIERFDAVAVQADGKILVAGQTNAGGGDVVVYRLKPDADDPAPLDPTFGSGGVVTFGGPGAQAGEAIALAPDGKIVIAGRTGIDLNAIVYRLNPDGSPDTSFGDGGAVAVTAGGNDDARAVALDAGGKILAAGYSTNGNHGFVFRLHDTDDSPGGTPPPPPGGGNATDDPECKGAQVTVSGTSGRDRIRGTSGRDVIAGLGGRDTIDGRGGNDLICGGSGNDSIKGGSGRDRLLGDGGNDRLRGGSGRDRLEGGRGRDTLIGGGSRDRLIGGPGRDRLRQ